MSQSDIVLRTGEICNEFDSRVATVGLTFARLELAKRLAETERAAEAGSEAALPSCTPTRAHEIDLSDNTLPAQAREASNKSQPETVTPRCSYCGSGECWNQACTFYKTYYGKPA